MKYPIGSRIERRRRSKVEWKAEGLAILSGGRMPVYLRVPASRVEILKTPLTFAFCIFTTTNNNNSNSNNNREKSLVGFAFGCSL
eukprot:gene7447-5245_t